MEETYPDPPSGQADVNNEVDDNEADVEDAEIVVDANEDEGNEVEDGAVDNNDDAVDNDATDSAVEVTDELNAEIDAAIVTAKASAKSLYPEAEKQISTRLSGDVSAVGITEEGSIVIIHEGKYKRMGETEEAFIVMHVKDGVATSARVVILGLDRVKAEVEEGGRLVSEHGTPTPVIDWVR